MLDKIVDQVDFDVGLQILELYRAWAVDWPIRWLLTIFQLDGMLVNSITF